MFEICERTAIIAPSEVLADFLLSATCAVSVKRSPPTSYQAFAFLELKTMELATSVLDLDGIVYKETQLKMRRPSDYNPQLVPAA